MDGDLILGSLMMVHERQNDMVCGPIMPQGGVQAVEAMLYTLDFISDQVDFIPGVRLGAHILDDCDKDTRPFSPAAALPSPCLPPTTALPSPCLPPAAAISSSCLPPTARQALIAVVSGLT
ncbi:hypothetical protein O3P69_019019 [Scylla paramamosain]|uniref:Receptor ligand binding region domain-containing protein n=1 Tax=Scylla paramamosain TaxID=85552 RepID=A0AAW0T7J0_SCYPA